MKYTTVIHKLLNQAFPHIHIHYQGSSISKCLRLQKFIGILNQRDNKTYKVSAESNHTTRK